MPTYTKNAGREILYEEIPMCKVGPATTGGANADANLDRFALDIVEALNAKEKFDEEDGAGWDGETLTEARAALDEIERLLDWQDWTPETCDEIARVLRDTGREVRDLATRRA
jgi:hypothetical protein